MAAEQSWAEERVFRYKRLFLPRTYVKSKLVWGSIDRVHSTILLRINFLTFTSIFKKALLHSPDAHHYLRVHGSVLFFLRLPVNVVILVEAAQSGQPVRYSTVDLTPQACLIELKSPSCCSLFPADLQQGDYELNPPRSVCLSVSFWSSFWHFLSLENVSDNVGDDRHSNSNSNNAEVELTDRAKEWFLF